LIFHAKEHELRRCLVANVDEAVGALALELDQVGGAEPEHEQERRPRQEVALARCRQTTDRHAQDGREQHRVGEERQEQDVRRKPADGGQFEEQHENADEKEIESCASRRGHEADSLR
jgi:hypothetical protein